MKRKDYLYDVALKRNDQELYIRGIASFFVDNTDEGILVISAYPPELRVLVKSEEDVDRVVQRWWSLFVNRMRKFAGSKTIIKGVTIREVNEE